MASDRSDTYAFNQPVGSIPVGERPGPAVDGETARHVDRPDDPDTLFLRVLKPLFTIVIPIAILLTLSDADRLGAIPALLLSLALPVGYGGWELARSRRLDVTAAISIVGLLFTGLIGLLELRPEWFAYKEAAIPLLFSVLIIASAGTRYPLVRLLFDQVVVRDKVDRAIEERGNARAYRTLIIRTSWLWAGTMAASGIMRYILAVIVVTSRPGTAAFNHELGTMSALRIPTVTIGTMILMIGTITYLVRGTSRLTGLAPSEFFRGGQRFAALLDRF